METEPALRATWRGTLPRRLGATLAGAPPGEVPAAAPGLRRRQAITVAFLVLGSLTLGVTLHLHAGDPLFYPATFALAAVWIVGAVASGPLRLGSIATGRGPRRPWAEAVLIGVGLAGIFAVGGAVVRELPYLGDRVAGVLAYTHEGSLPVLLGVTALNGVAEELFFRGAVFAALPRRPVALTTLYYTAVTLATGNVMLAAAALVLGLVVALERRATGGVLASVLTHVSWSLVVLLVLPPIFG